MKNILNKLFVIICLILPYNSMATSVIRDSEIENAINEVIAPLIKVSRIRNLKMHILSENSINAFTAGGNEIFVNSGLIATFPDADLFRGVIAHEMGHVMGHHVMRQIDNIENQQKVAASAMAIGLAGALAGAPVVAIGAIAGGVNYADSTILQSSRVFESSADQAALKLLEKSGNTSIGLLKLLTYLENHSNNLFTNPYEMTHPLSTDRINTIASFVVTSKFKNSRTPPKISHNFRRAAFKLYAFTIPLNAAISPSGSEEIDHYVMAIIAMRKGKLEEAINYINMLLELRPKDPYYHELKGQILFTFGKKEALASYQRAIKLLPKDALLKISRAAVMLNLDGKNQAHFAQIIDDLKFAQKKEPDNLMPYYFLSVVYDKSKDNGHSSLNHAIFLFKQGNLKDAKMMARIAVKYLPSNSPDWYKANDIILTER